jgi:hypothetical protein
MEAGVGDLHLSALRKYFPALPGLSLIWISWPRTQGHRLAPLVADLMEVRVADAAEQNLEADAAEQNLEADAAEQNLDLYVARRLIGPQELIRCKRRCFTSSRIGFRAGEFCTCSPVLCDCVVPHPCSTSAIIALRPGIMLCRLLLSLNEVGSVSTQ